MAVRIRANKPDSDVLPLDLYYQRYVLWYAEMESYLKMCFFKYNINISSVQIYQARSVRGPRARGRRGLLPAHGRRRSQPGRALRALRQPCRMRATSVVTTTFFKIENHHSNIDKIIIRKTLN